jgi:hypothetical protein
LAPVFFVLKLTVALARVCGKIARRQRLEHTSGVSKTYKAGTRTWGKSVTVFSN